MKPHRHRRKPRSGTSLYVTVMGVGMVVGTIALTTSLVGRIALKANQSNAEMTQAQAAAHSGIEYALNWMNRNGDWRTQLTSGGDRTDRTWNGAFTWSVTDTDGNLADDARDHAVLRSVGRSGVAQYAIEVDIEPAGRALSCLEATICSGGDLLLGDGSEVKGSGFLHANNHIDVTSASADIRLDAEAVGECRGGTYHAEKVEGVASRELPGEHALDWYLEVGTEIAWSDVPESFGARRISSRRFSRELNPFGDPNPRGIYWIDCQGESLNLEYTRVLGTLLLLNAGPSTRFSQVLVMQSEAQNYPTLIVQGDLRIDLRGTLSGQELHEGFGANYNPVGIPYNGVEDDDDDDKYPARLDGIVYVTGTATVTDESKLLGNLVAGSVVIEDGEALEAEYRPYSYNYPPPGFSAGQGVRVLPGTWKRTGL